MTSPVHHCGTCTECVPKDDEPRGSRAPEGMETLDPRLLDPPEDAKREKEGGG